MSITDDYLIWDEIYSSLLAALEHIFSTSHLRVNSKLRYPVTVCTEQLNYIGGVFPYEVGYNNNDQYLVSRIPGFVSPYYL